MAPHLSEFLGTATLVLIGTSVSASAHLARTRGEGASWAIQCGGWALALFLAMWVAVPSGAHLNPAVTLALAAAGELGPGRILPHMGGQLGGALVGAALAVLAFLPHWRRTPAPDSIRAAMFPLPAVDAPFGNMLSAFIGSAMFVFAVFAVASRPWQPPEGMIAGSEAWRTDWWRFTAAAAMALFVIGVGPGGASGGAINPARDLAGRVVHAVLPVAGKEAGHWRGLVFCALGAVGGAVCGALLAKAVML